MNLLDLFVAIKVDDQASDQIESFGNRAKSALGTAGKMGAAMAVDAIVEFGQSALETGMEFDAAMAQVAATGGMTMDELAENVGTTSTAYGDFEGNLRDFAKFMGSNTKFTAVEAAEALNYMALAGYDAQTSMDMLPSVLNLAAAGNMDLATASDMVTDTQSALGLSLEETYTLIDQMAAASANSNTSVEQLGSAFLTVGGTAKNLSGGTLEAATALGILANNGIKGAEGGTALRNIINALIPKSDDAAYYFEKLGAEFFDADGNMRPLNESFGELSASMENLTTEEKIKAMSAMFNKYDLKSVSALLANTVEGVDKVTYSLLGLIGQRDDADAFWESIGLNLSDTGHNFDDLDQIIYDTMDESGHVTEQTREKLYEYGLSAEQVDYIMDGLQDTVLNGTSAWTDLETSIDASWYTMSSLSDAMAGAGINFEAASGNLELLGIDADELATALGACGGDAEVFAQLLQQSATEGVSLDEVIAAMGGSLEDVQTAFDNTTGAAQQMADTQLDNLAGDLTIMGSAADGLRIALEEKVDPALRDFTQMGTTAISGLAALVSGDQESADAAFAQLGEQINTAWGNITSGVDEALPDLETFFTDLPTNITTWVGELGTLLSTAGGDLLQGLFDGIGTVVPTVAEFFLSLPSTVITLIGDVATSLGQTGIDLLGGLFSGAASLLVEGSEYRTWLTDLPTTLMNAIGSTVDTLVTTGSDFLGGMMTGFNEIAPTMLEYFSSLPSVLGEMLGDLAGYLINKGKDFIGGFYSGNTEDSQNLVDFFTSIPETLLGLLGDVAGFLVDAGNDFIGGFFEGTDMSSEDLVAFFTSLPQVLLDMLGSAGEIAGFLVDAGSDFLGGLFTGVGEASPDIVAFFLSLPQTLLDLLGDIGSFLLDAGSSFITGFMTGVGISSDDVAAFFSSLPQTLLGLLGDIGTFLLGAGQDLMGGMLDGIKQITGIDLSDPNSISGFVSGIPSAIVTFIGGVGDTLLQTGKDLIGGLLDGIKEIFGIDMTQPGAVLKFVQEIPGKVVEFIGNLGDTLSQKGKDLLNGFLDGVMDIFGIDENTAGSMLSMIHDIPQKIIDALGDLGDTLYQAGVDLIDGFTGGIEDFINDPIGTLAGLGQSLIDTATSVLDENSPSKEFHEIGKNVVLGLDGGIDDESGTPDSTLTGIAGGLTGNFVDAYWQMHDQGVALMTSFGTGLSNAFYGGYGVGDVAGTIGTIGSSVGSYFAAGYYSLYGAGQQIMLGLNDGIVSTWNNTVVPNLQAITASIPNWKGPLDKDRSLLTDNGEAIMDGLIAGIETGAGRLYGMLGNVTSAIPSAATATGQLAPAAAGGTTINMADAFRGANISFRSREDMREFSEMLADTIARETTGRYLVA